MSTSYEDFIEIGHRFRFPLGMQDLIGWAASGLLLLTIATQIVRQWQSGTSKGVSHWLFIGQIAASGMFTVYSVMLKNYVFIVTNALMLLSAIVGLGMVMYHRKNGKDEKASDG